MADAASDHCPQSHPQGVITVEATLLDDLNYLIYIDTSSLTWGTP
jgi:hypothetical protein